LGLRCPYCDEELPSHRDLRVHVGATHREKTDEFMEEHFGGRWIEADFVTLMVRSGEVKEILKSDVIWKCTSCISCKELCPDETPPFEIIKTLRSLSARIGYHFPQGYKEIDEKVSLSGIIQDPQPVLSRTGERLERNDLGLPTLDAPVNLKKFTEAVEKLSKMRVVI